MRSAVHAASLEGGEAAASTLVRRRIGFLLRKAYQRNMMIWQALSVDLQLTSVQAATLSALYLHGPLSLTELGRAIATDPATTRGVVERLREREMISLADAAEDKRKVIVHLEEKGRRLHEIMEPVVDEISEETVKALNPAERVALEYLLLKITGGDDSKYRLRAIRRRR